MPNYRDTLNLPRDILPMRANLPQREPEIQRAWEEAGIYEKSLAREGETWVLHDGPPYSNGDIHVGHALNKILKDVIVRHRSMQGRVAPYVPGWDNHGLPIEHAVVEAARAAGETPDRAEVRRRCRAYAAKYIDLQREQFKRLGIRGAWDRPYITMAPEFEAHIVEVFAELALKGYVYRGLKPILWCPYDETALAEAEVEYEEKTSPSIYVRFPLAEDPRGVLGTEGAAGLSTLIWTTTPWTIPANLAVAFHPELEYVVARVGSDRYLLAAGLLEAAMTACGFPDYEVTARFRGAELEGVRFRHPLAQVDPVFDRVSPAVLADYVTLEAGTGVVHTAPGHGVDDFQTGRRYGLEVLNPVDGAGRFTALAGPFAGKAIRSGEADAAVLAALAEAGHLVKREPYRHSYPHCWRCHGPVIFRTTVQWFMDIDHPLPEGGTHREKALAAIGEVNWVPPEAVNRIQAMVAGRPDWCLSRQRAWGVGIPAFYCGGCEEPILTRETLDRVIALVRERSADAWFETPAEEILGLDFRCPHCACAGPFTRETDVLDVWVDSGSSWRAVLESGRWPELKYPADVYIEGSDQHRGWFNSSLMLSVAARGRAPYRTVITCGFVLDENGAKMSKSLGNVVDPLEEIERGGADILRLWVASVGYFEDVRIGREILDQVRAVFMRVRNTLRFLVGNLGDFDPATDAVPFARLPELDRWALHRLCHIARETLAAYDAYNYKQVFHEVPYYCTADLGAFYLDLVKDRLYCSAPTEEGRRAAQTALYQIARTLTQLLAPIMPHTAEEVWAAIPGARAESESVHLTLFPGEATLRAWDDADLGARWERLRAVRDRVNAAIEPLKPKAKNDPDFVLKSSLEAAVTLTAGPDWYPLLARYREQLPTVLMVPVVELAEQPGEGLEARVTRAPGPRCERCWLVLPTVGSVAAHPDLCARCAAVVG
jgi:isoleucyl-tRNA synthetase